jgi:hypothetical protein
MPAEPPWKWVEGDRVRAAQFRIFFGVLMGYSVLVVIVLTLEFLVTVGGWSGPTIPVWAGFALLLPWAAGLFLWAFGVIWRRFPIVGRLGISPVGLRLMIPPRGLTVRWPAVLRVGPDFVDVIPGLRVVRFRLTTNQVQQISSFRQPH